MGELLKPPFGTGGGKGAVMANDPTEPEVREMLKRAEKAMFGPWVPKMYDDEDRPTWGVRQGSSAPSVMVGDEILPCGFAVCNFVEQDMGDIENGLEAATARFVAHARTDLPRLAQAYLRQRDLLRRCGELIGNSPTNAVLVDKRNQLLAEIQATDKEGGGGDPAHR